MRGSDSWKKKTHVHTESPRRAWDRRGNRSRQEGAQAGGGGGLSEPQETKEENLQRRELQKGTHWIYIQIFLGSLADPWTTWAERLQRGGDNSWEPERAEQRLIPIINMDGSILNKILTVWIQQHIKRITHLGQVGIYSRNAIQMLI